MKQAATQMVVCIDVQRRVCMQTLRSSTEVQYLRFEPGRPLDVYKERAAEFDKRWKPLTDYPVEKYVRHILSWAQDMKMTARVLDAVKKVTKVSAAEVERLVWTAPLVEPSPDGTEVDAPAFRRAGVPRVKGAGSGAFICAKLLEGKLTPEQILEAVHKEFPGRKTTVKDVLWNKRKLQKEGRLA